MRIKPFHDGLLTARDTKPKDLQPAGKTPAVPETSVRGPHQATNRPYQGRLFAPRVLSPFALLLNQHQPNSTKHVLSANQILGDDEAACKSARHDFRNVQVRTSTLMYLLSS